jgi:biopolymer transport protein ExbD
MLIEVILLIGLLGFITREAIYHLFKVHLKDTATTTTATSSTTSLTTNTPKTAVLADQKHLDNDSLSKQLKIATDKLEKVYIHHSLISNTHH